MPLRHHWIILKQAHAAPSKRVRTKRITLLNTSLGRNDILSKEKMTVLRITKVDPFIDMGEFFKTFLQKNMPFHALIKSIFIPMNSGLFSNSSIKCLQACTTASPPPGAQTHCEGRKKLFAASLMREDRHFPVNLL